MNTRNILDVIFNMVWLIAVCAQIAYAIHEPNVLSTGMAIFNVYAVWFFGPHRNN